MQEEPIHPIQTPLLSRAGDQPGTYFPLVWECTSRSLVSLELRDLSGNILRTRGSFCSIQVKRQYYVKKAPSKVVSFFTKDMTVIYEHTRYRMPLIRVNFSSYNDSNSQKTRTKHMQINRILFIFVLVFFLF